MIHIDSERLLRELHQLSQFNELTAPAVTRILFSEEDMQARAYTKTLCEAAHLSIREDAIGNTFARWQGSEPQLPAVATGSHIDAIPNAGMYDGTVGVLAALEAIRALQTSGYRPKRSIELIIFTAEEPTRFGVGCLGSRMMAGNLSPEAVCALRDADGNNPDQVRLARGFDGRLEEVRLDSKTYHAFVELHIEQGPLLEAQQIDIGIVSAIAAPATLHVTLEGDGGHAGATLMPERRDALNAAAEISLLAERTARDSSIDSVATVGILDVFPGAVNSIPSRVFMTLDIRDIKQRRRDEMIEIITSGITTVTQKRNISPTITILNSDPPATCDQNIIQACQAAASQHGLSTLHMVSRAYHDALFMAQLCPTAMIFIPCKNGVSHRPDEYSSPAAISQGALVLASCLQELSSE